MNTKTWLIAASLVGKALAVQAKDIVDTPVAADNSVIHEIDTLLMRATLKSIPTVRASNSCGLSSRSLGFPMARTPATWRC
jgi:hypothetical protein